MIVRLLLRLLVVAAAFIVTAWVVPDVELKGGFLAALWVALIFGVVSIVLGPILHLISLPITVMTLGLFSLVINGILLAAVAGLTKYLDVGNFLWTIVAALVLTVVTVVFDAITTRLTGQTGARKA